MPRGLDRRLVSMPEGWLDSIRKKLGVYQNLSLNLSGA